jgi:3-hydroxyisobutyrate dehydrogenase
MTDVAGASLSKIGFIGTGIMGSPMAGHLIDTGYDVCVYNRTESKAAPLVEKGARLARSVAEAAFGADVVITMVGYPEDVENVYMGTGGILESARRGAYLIDMSTSSPKLAREIHDYAETTGQHAFDAPVTGGETGAITASLTIFCGATDEEIAPVLPILKAMGSLVLAFGEPGSGQMAKLANQVALAGSMLGMVEGLSFAKEGGLDMDKMLSALMTGTAASASLKAYGAKILRGDYRPGFQVRHFIKDLNLALTTAQEEELTLPTTETAINLYSLLSEIGGDYMGTQALSLVYADEQTCADAGLDWSRLNLDEDDEAGGGDGGEADAAGFADSRQQ